MSSIKHALFLIVTFCVASYNFCVGQSSFYKKYSIQQGLLSSDNYRVTQDLEGYIWICSEAGIVKFDGANFKTFTIKEGLSFNDVWEIHIDSKNRKWLNSFANGIQYIENDIVKTIKKSLEIDQLYYAGEHQDTVFFYNGNEEGVKRYYFAPNGDFGHYDRFSKLGYEVWGDFREQGKFILIPKVRDDNYKLKLYDIKTKKIEDINHHLLYAQERSMKEIGVFMDNENPNRFYTWKNGIIQELFVDENITNNMTQIIVDPTSNYSFIKTPNWIYAYSNFAKLERDFEAEEILNKRFPFLEKIEYIHIDKESNIWITELRGEVYFIPQMARWAANSIMDSKFPLDANVSSILDYENDILFLSRSFKIYDYNKSEGEIKLIRDNKKIFRHWKIRNNNLYILFLGELCIYPISNNDNQISVNWNAEKKIPVGGTLTFDFINDTTIILGNGRMVDLNKLEESDILTIKLPQRTNNVLMKGSTLIYTFINGISTFHFETKKIVETPIRNAVFIKSIGKYIVAGTKGEGVQFLELKSGNLIKKNHLFNDYDVNDVVVYNDVWYFATNKGIISAKLKSDLSMRDVNVYLNQTLLGLHINRLVVDEKTIYAYTTKGMYTIDRLAYTKRQVNTIPFKTIMKCRGIKFPYGKNIELTSYQNYLNFSFSPVSFYNLGEATFRYKLSDWKEWKYTTELSVDLENLDPGSYTFIVESSENKFNSFANRVVYKFNIDKPIYEKWWFRIVALLCLILIIGSTNLVVRRVTAKKMKRKTQMKNIELKALRAQLNPHFVFNSLNTIQSMIILRSEREANEYIVSFAELMRKVLDNSNYERVTLKNEIDFLENYLMLENIRINYTLDYDISYEKDLNLSEIMVYSMVYQPIVENVLVHAFLTNQSDKQLDISFSLENEMLTAIIIDNGIGREKSAELNKNKTHKSWASTILNEKADLLNEMKKKELSIEIIDLYDDGIAAGTKVIVTMRIIRKKELN